MNLRFRTWLSIGLSVLLTLILASTAAQAHGDLTAHQAQKKSLRWVKSDCRATVGCKGYNAKGCGSFLYPRVCAVWEYLDTPRDGRFACKRLISWLRLHQSNPKFETRWDCDLGSGWNPGPGPHG